MPLAGAERRHLTGVDRANRHVVATEFHRRTVVLQQANERCTVLNTNLQRGHAVDNPGQDQAVGVGPELDPGLGTEGTRTEIAEAVLDRQLDAEVGRGRRHQRKVQAAVDRCLGKADRRREAE